MSDERLVPDGEALPTLRSSPVYTPAVIDEIQEKAVLGRYRIRGFGTLRERPLPSLDDLTFLPASLTRIPLEGYRERCRTTTVLGTRFAEQPIELEIPVMITGMSYGALSLNAKVALARRAPARSAARPRRATGACSRPSATTRRS